MKVAIINYTWGDSSTGKITVNMYDGLVRAGHDAKVFFGVMPTTGTERENFIYFGNKAVFFIDHIISNLTGLSGALSFLTTRKLFKMLDDYSPDIIWLYNLHGGYVNEYWLLDYAKKKAKWTIYSMADEYPFLGKCCYSYDCDKYMFERGCYDCPQLRDSPRSLIFDNSQFHFKMKEKAYKDFDHISFVSAPYVVDKAKKSWLVKDKEFFISDSHVDVQHMYYPRATEKIREELKIPVGKRIMLVCASISSAYKGVKYFLEAARRCLSDDIVFINVGYGGDEALCPSNYIPLPYVHDQNRLSELMSLADAYVCTSIVDAQPNACLNALGCGTPIIGFNVSGVPYIAPEGLGTYVTPFDVDELCDAIRKTPKKTQAIINACHEYAMQRYDLSKATNDMFDTISKRVENNISGTYNFEKSE